MAPLVSTLVSPLLTSGVPISMGHSAPARIAREGECELARWPPTWPHWTNRDDPPRHSWLPPDRDVQSHRVPPRVVLRFEDLS